MAPACPWHRGDRAVSRGWGTAIVVALHVMALVVIVKATAVRPILAEARTVFVTLVAAVHQPEAAPSPVPPPTHTAPKRKLEPRRKAVPDTPSTPAPTVLPPQPTETATDVEIAAIPAAPAFSPQMASAAVAPPPPSPTAARPKQITQVAYVRPPELVYPALSRRMNEQGRVVVRVLIDARGRAVRVELEHASPYERLNQAALKAAHGAIYQPHVEDGVPLTVWALIPLVFELKG